MAHGDIASKLEIPKRWSDKTARDILGAQERSGKSIIRFSKEHGIDPMRLYRWKRRLRSTSAFPEQRAFIPVKVHATPKVAAAGGSVELVLGNGRVVRVMDDFDEDILRRLVLALEDVPPC